MAQQEPAATANKSSPPPTLSPPPRAILAQHKMSPTTPTPGDNTSGAHGQQQPQSSSSPSPLLTTLNRLSMSTSRPNLPPQEGYATRTFRSMSTSVSNSLHSLTGTMWDAAGKGRSTENGTQTLPRGHDRALSLDASKRTGTESDTPSFGSIASTLQRRASFSSLDMTSILYPTLENHPAPLAHPLLVLDLAALTAVPPTISHEALLATLLGRLEPWVGEEGEGSGYCLIVLAAEDPHGKTKVRELPGVAWWLWHWRRIPRKYRKNLKRLYIVHPSTMTRTVLPILIPLVSPKSFAKLHTVPSLLGLARRGISLAGIDIPLTTLKEEARVLRDHPDAANGHAATNMAIHTAPAGWFSSISSYLPWTPQAEGEAAENKDGDAASQQTAVEPEVPYWSQDIDDLFVQNEGHLPRALRDIGAAIIKYCADTEGIFRKSAYTTLSPSIRAFLDLPMSRQPRIDWAAVSKLDPLLPPILYKRLLANLPAPIISTSLYPALRKSFTIEEIKANILVHLSPARSMVLEHTVHIAHHLLAHEEITRMNARSLAIVIAPALIAGDPREDAMLCMEPGKILPMSLLNMTSMKVAMADSDSEADDMEGVDADASEVVTPVPATIPEQTPTQLHLPTPTQIHLAQHKAAQPQSQQAAPRASGENTLVGVLETYIAEYAAFVGAPSSAEGHCECGLPDTGAHTPVTRQPPASPQKGLWVLGGAQLAPPVET